MAVSNSTGKMKLSYDNVSDMTIVEEVQKKDRRIIKYVYGFV